MYKSQTQEMNNAEMYMVFDSNKFSLNIDDAIFPEILTI